MSKRLAPLPSVRVLLAGVVLAAIAALALTTAAPRADAAEDPGPAAPRTWFPKDIDPEDLLPPELATATGVFRIKLVGFQTTRWSHHSTPEDSCDGTSEGSGTEKVVFSASKKRTKLSAFGEKKLEMMVFQPLKVKGRVTRKGHYNYTPPPVIDPSCPQGDGTGEGPPPPDCGRRNFSGVPVSLVALDGFVKLSSEADGWEYRPDYRMCPNLATKWPTIIAEKTNGKPIHTRLRPKLIFHPKFKRSKPGKFSKNILLAKGTQKRRSFTTASSTVLEWRLTLKRLR